MAGTQPPAMRQPLHIHIERSPYTSQNQPSPNSSSPSPSSLGLGSDSTRTSPSSGDSSTVSTLQDDLFVLCMYDFQAADEDQLSFRKNEILVVVKQEDRGWWAARRKEEERTGWIPKDYVRPLTDDMAEQLLGVQAELRSYWYNAELIFSAPIARDNQLYDLWPEKDPAQARVKVLPRNGISVAGRQAGDHRQDHSHRSNKNLYPPTRPGHKSPPLPATVVPQPVKSYNSGINKLSSSGKEESMLREPGRFIKSPSIRRKPMMDAINVRVPDPVPAVEISLRRPWADRGRRTPTSENEAYLEPVLVLQGSIPWYLKPQYTDQLESDTDGNVRFGTVAALVERLVVVSPDDKIYQNIFLMTFRTFMTAESLFNTLIEYYNRPQPEDLNVSELEDWIERGQLRTQRRVLELFGEWLQSHRLVKHEPHIAEKLDHFLQSITTSSNVKVAKMIRIRIQDLTSPNSSPVNFNLSPTTPRRRRSRPHKNDLLKMNPTDVAEQLSLIQYEAYSIISPQECILYSKSKGSDVTNLREFCASYDKLVSWVQTSVLLADSTKRRSETVDFWIKVAEKCRALNNFASMSSIITALSSSYIRKLKFTWVHVNRKSALESLLRYNEPVGGFAAYRDLLNHTEGSCVPFITMYLTELAHIHDQLTDKERQINFYKRKRVHEVVSAILRHQNKPYAIPMDDATAAFVRNYLHEPAKDPRWLWAKSHDILHLELTHADLRRGLEKAGF